LLKPCRLRVKYFAHIFMIHLRGLFFLLLLFPGAARRSIRTDDSYHRAQQQNKALVKGLKLSAELAETLIPGGLGTGVLHRARLGVGSLREGRNQHGRHTTRFEPHLPATWFRFGTHRAKIGLQAASGPQENQGLPKEASSGGGNSKSPLQAASWPATVSKQAGYDKPASRLQPTSMTAACDEGDEVARDSLSREEEAKKAWLAKQNVPTWGKAATGFANAAPESAQMAEMTAACDEVDDVACDDLSHQEEVKRASLAKLDVPSSQPAGYSQPAEWLRPASFSDTASQPGGYSQPASSERSAIRWAGGSEPAGYGQPSSGLPPASQPTTTSNPAEYSQPASSLQPNSRPARASEAASHDQPASRPTTTSQPADYSQAASSLQSNSRPAKASEPARYDQPDSRLRPASRPTTASTPADDNQGAGKVQRLSGNAVGGAGRRNAFGGAALAGFLAAATLSLGDWDPTALQAQYRMVQESATPAREAVVQAGRVAEVQQKIIGRRLRDEVAPAAAQAGAEAARAAGDLLEQTASTLAPIAAQAGIAARDAARMTAEGVSAGLLEALRAASKALADAVEQAASKAEAERDAAEQAASKAQAERDAAEQAASKAEADFKAAQKALQAASKAEAELDASEQAASKAEAAFMAAQAEVAAEPAAELAEETSDETKSAMVKAEEQAMGAAAEPLAVKPALKLTEEMGDRAKMSESTKLTDELATGTAAESLAADGAPEQAAARLPDEVGVAPATGALGNVGREAAAQILDDVQGSNTKYADKLYELEAKLQQLEKNSAAQDERFAETLSQLESVARDARLFLKKFSSSGAADPEGLPPATSAAAGQQ